jgi:hypothetical protein
MNVVLLSRSVGIAAPADVIFAAMTNWSRQSEWMIGTSVAALTQEGLGVGGTLAARTRIGPLSFLDPMTITEWQPPKRCAVLHTGRIVRGSGVFAVRTISEEMSEFTWLENVEVPFGIIGRAGWVLIKQPIGFGLSLSLKRFKHWVEQEQPRQYRAFM